MTKINDIPWLANNGHLSPAQRWQIAVTAIRKRWATRSRASATASASSIDIRALDALEPPRNPIALAALTTATEAQPPWLLQHALRTYAWGSLLAMTEGRSFESTTLFAASLLHDLGLTEFAAEPQDHCFAVRGARAARQVLLAAGASERQAAYVAGAISLHLDMTVAAENGIEARLLQAGAGLDVIGNRAEEIPETVRHAVLERHPRIGMKRALCQCMRHEAQQAPDTRIGLYVRRFKFLDRIERAPFDD